MMEQCLIDANALAKKIELMGAGFDGIGAVLVKQIAGVLRNEYDAPTINAVEVVRCKDCLHSRELNKYEKQLYLSECVGCTYHSVSYQDSVMMGDDFCSYGERRDSDG